MGVDMDSVRESLRQRVEELEGLLQRMPAYIWIARDPECREIVGTDAANRLLGFAPGTNTSQSVVHEGLAPKLLQFDLAGNELAVEDLPIQRAIASRAPVRDFEFQIVVPEGRRVWLRGHAEPLFEADGRTIRGAIGLFIDVTPLHEADRSIRERDHRLQLATQGARVGFWDWDMESGALRWSRENEEIYGVAPGSVRSYADWRRFVHPWDVELVEREAQAVAKAVHEFEFRIVRDDGQTRWVYTRGGPVPGARGSIAGINLDITDRKRAEEDLSRARMALEAARRANLLGIHDYDVRTGRITADPRCRELLGIGAADEYTIDDFWNAIVPADREAVRETLARAFDPKGSGVYVAEYRVGAGEDRLRWIRANGVAQFEGDEVVRLIGTVQDVTEAREQTEALRDANRRKAEFLSMLSHELRNPLAPLGNGLHLIRNGPPGSATMRRGLEIAERQFQHLKRLVDDLLDLNRIDSGKIRIDLEWVDLSTLVRRIVEDHRGLFDGRGVTLEPHVPDSTVGVWGDAARLTQSVGNLLQNASKFTDPGGWTRVCLEAGEREAVLTITDSGVGMDHEALAQAFEPFAQSGRTVGRTSGLGLGLALVKGIVERHCGSVGVSSEGPGRGTRFTIRLPLAPEPVDPAVPEAEPAPPGHHRILIVEDHEDARTSLQCLLEMLGHAVVAAKDGETALAMIREAAPTVVLCDIGLPGISGLEVARQVSRMSGLSRPRLVALSGYGTEDDRQRAKDAGFDAHLTKPPNLEALQRLLASPAEVGRSAPGRGARSEGARPHEER